MRTTRSLTANPVLLVHGLAAKQTVNWQTFSPLLANEGYCVFSLTYGVFSLTYGVKEGVGAPGLYQPGGLAPMEESAAELSAFVDRVLEATGASHVDILGHSEGTLMPATTSASSTAPPRWTSTSA